ncbi:hypothetical protein KU74_12380 [Pectobacterium brasiliense]|uniref:Uncharacterized protein n=1 Tax=Pectobacterium brasiliense TaxID=180957 RepID=A0A0M2F0P9_9GAMM|nr:hypothetical protein [Pectobacterium brasiliense]KGA34263.1 hypothetical protein KU74_12380 [Pectobacterium brasiliense]
MILVRAENIKSNTWLASLSRGDYGIGMTFVHLAIAFLLAAINYFFLGRLGNGSIWVGYFVIAIMVFYGIYVANIGMGFWRLARKLSEVKTFLLRFLAAVCVMVGISAIFNGLALVFTLLAA